LKRRICGAFGLRLSLRLSLRLALALALGLALALALALGACRSTPAIKDDAATIAHRVVSLSPSTTETLVAIGARDALVGRSRYCDYPPDVLPLPQVGGYADPNLEAILALRPDLVVGARGPAGPAIVEKLATHGARTWFPETESLAQIDLLIVGLGERTGHAREAEAVVAKLHAREEAVTAAVKSEQRPRVLLVFGLEPIVVAGKGSFPAELVDRAGGDNVVTEGGRYPVLGMESVMALDPDIILNAAIAEAHGAERIGTDSPGWKHLRAVKSGRVAALTDESVLRPGPRVGDALAIFARAVHPGVPIP
jgi:iron complex transport system substrate-binding protein